MVVLMKGSSFGLLEELSQDQMFWICFLEKYAAFLTNPAYFSVCDILQQSNQMLLDYIIYHASLLPYCIGYLVPR